MYATRSKRLLPLRRPSKSKPALRCNVALKDYQRGKLLSSFLGSGGLCARDHYRSYVWFTVDPLVTLVIRFVGAPPICCSAIV